MFPVVLVASVWMALFLEGDAGNLEGIEYLPDAMGSGLHVYKRLLQSIVI